MPIRPLSVSEAHHRVEDLSVVLLDCVQGGASVGFMRDLDGERCDAFWRRIADGVGRGERVLLVAEDGTGRIDGTVQLVLAQPDNQPHRADVAKMLVHRRARRQGIAQRLLAAVEEQARAHGKTVLVLDTVSGSDAGRLYARCG